MLSNLIRHYALESPAFIGKEIPDEAANPNGLKAKGRPPHLVFTADLIDEAGQPTHEAVNEIIAFFQHALSMR